jgi:AraC-like DNA-binding protein
VATRAGRRAPLMRSQLCGPAIALVRERAGDAAALRLVRELGLPEDVEDLAKVPEVVLPFAKLDEFLARAAEASGVAAFGLRLAERFPRGGYGVLEYACRTAPTVRAALERLVRYMRLLNEVVTVRFEEHDATGRGAPAEAVLEQRFPEGVVPAHGHLGEFFVATLLLGARGLADAACVPLRAWFVADASPDEAALRTLLGTRELAFGQRGNGVALPRAFLDRPLRGADPALLALLDRQAEQLLGARPASGRTAELVRHRVLAAFARGLPSVADVAAELSMSARTLQRRLGDEGVSFAGVLDDVRQELALRHVREKGRPLGEIAFLLGYAELSPFLRAFKRWTGKTPAAFRA